jgi:hypothetical protein
MFGFTHLAIKRNSPWYFAQRSHLWNAAYCSLFHLLNKLVLFTTLKSSLNYCRSPNIISTTWSIHTCSMAVIRLTGDYEEESSRVGEGECFSLDTIRVSTVEDLQMKMHSNSTMWLLGRRALCDSRFPALAIILLPSSILVLLQREHNQIAESTATSATKAAITQQLLWSNLEFEICSHQNDSCILLGIIVCRLRRKRINGSSQAASCLDKSTFPEMIIVCSQSRWELCVRNIACLEWVPSLTHFGHMMLSWPCFTNERKCLAYYGLVSHAAGFFLDKYAHTWVWQIVLCHLPPSFWSNQRQFVLPVLGNLCIVTRVRPLSEKAMVCYI